MQMPTLEYISNWFKDKTVAKENAAVGILEIYEHFIFDFFKDTRQLISISTFCLFLKVDPEEALETVFPVSLNFKESLAESPEEDPLVASDIVDSPEVGAELVVLIPFLKQLKAEEEELVRLGASY